MRKRNIFRSDALKLFCWAIIPLLILACTCAKTVENKAQRTVDTVIITRADTTLTDALRRIYDNTRESLRTSDSTAWRMVHDTIVKEIWHREVVERERLVQTLDSARTMARSDLTAYKSKENETTETRETDKEQWEDGRRTMYTVFAIVGGIILIVIYWDIKRKT